MTDANGTKHDGMFVTAHKDGTQVYLPNRGRVFVDLLPNVLTFVRGDHYRI